MSTPSSPALRPVHTGDGAIIHLASDRRLAVEHWLLSTHPEPRQARAEWAEHGVALLPLGTLFSAVRIPGPLVQAIAATTDPEELDAFLEDALDGGPVISDLGGNRYYALVPASVPRTWRAAADDWRTQDVDVLGRGCYLGVPRVDAVEHRPLRTYWSVPMASAAELCPPLTVARLIAAGVHRLSEIPEDAGSQPRIRSVTGADDI